MRNPCSRAVSSGALPLSGAVGARATTVSSPMDMRGRDTWKVAPFPSPSLAARTVPPCDSTMSRTIARPSPRPVLATFWNRADPRPGYKCQPRGRCKTRPVIDLLRFVSGLAADLVRRRVELVAENALLRQQLIVAKRKIAGRIMWTPWQRFTIVLAARIGSCHNGEQEERKGERRQAVRAPGYRWHLNPP